MNEIAIFGAGGLGREVWLILTKINQQKEKWKILGFFDDDLDLFSHNSNIPLKILGGMDQLNIFPRPLNLIIAVGNPLAMSTILGRINNCMICYPNIISTDSLIYDDASFLGQGNIVASGCLFTDNVKVGNHNLFNYNTSFGHDVVIGDFNVFNPGTTISGNVTIGDKNLFGMNSSVVQGKKIGSHNKIGACSLMLRNARDNESYFGVPAKKLDPRFNF